MQITLDQFKIKTMLNKRKIDRMFQTEYLPVIREIERENKIGKYFVDSLLRNEEYNTLLNMLFEDKRITQTQHDKYSIPRWMVR